MVNYKTKAEPCARRKKGDFAARNVKFGPSFSDLSSRIRELELALAELQAARSNEPHPLLAETRMANDSTAIHDTDSPKLEDKDEMPESETLIETSNVDSTAAKSSFFDESPGLEGLFHIHLEEDERIHIPSIITFYTTRTAHQTP
ncbi:hypothetical protein M422DRAFT_247897 [Sphaerobolus stellatus SS14]|nr:hypothetical protein M422DRAFT_247897 [Sphaerobolus stellatus SS14]